MAMPYPLCVHDGERVVLANPALAALFGADSSADLVGSRLDEHIHPDCLDGSHHRRRLIAETGQQLRSVAIKVVTPEGESRYCTVDSWRVRAGDVPLITTAVLDRNSWTGRPDDTTPAPDDAAETIAYLALDTAPVALCIHGPETIVFANGSARELLSARERDGLEGRPISDIVHPDARQAGTERKQLLFSDAFAHRDVQFKLLSLTGRTIYASGFGQPFETDDARHALVVVEAASEFNL